MEPTTSSSDNFGGVFGAASTPAPVSQVETLVNDVNKEAPTIQTLVTQASGIKAGYKTTEFWIVLGTDIGAVAAGVLPANSVVVKGISLGVLVLTSISYVWTRTALKSNT